MKKLFLKIRNEDFNNVEKNEYFDENDKAVLNQPEEEDQFNIIDDIGKQRHSKKKPRTFLMNLDDWNPGNKGSSRLAEILLNLMQSKKVENCPR